MDPKRLEALVLAQQICDDGDTTKTFEQIERWSDHDLFEWIENWGYTWDDVQGWVDLEDI